METYAVYILLDGANRILSVDSSAFLSDTTGWEQIDEGTGDRFHHAQNNYFPKPKYDERGIPRYTYVSDGSPKWRERTQGKWTRTMFRLWLNQVPRNCLML